MGWRGGTTKAGAIVQAAQKLAIIPVLPMCRSAACCGIGSDVHSRDNFNRIYG